MLSTIDENPCRKKTTTAQCIPHNGLFLFRLIEFQDFNFERLTASTQINERQNKFHGSKLGQAANPWALTTRIKQFAISFSPFQSITLFFFLHRLGRMTFYSDWDEAWNLRCRGWPSGRNCYKKLPPRHDSTVVPLPQLAHNHPENWAIQRYSEHKLKLVGGIPTPLKNMSQFG